MHKKSCNSGRFIFGSFISIWDADENETMRINIRMCKDPLIFPIYGPYGVGNCIVVLIAVVNEDYE